MKNKIYQNYHNHKDGSNIYTADSAVKYEDYAKRAIELGHKVLSTCEHGYQGKYFEAFDVAKKYGLKFIYSAEIYWVKDRFEKDNTNSHMMLIAKNNKGRKAINLAISEANETGYYYKPRLDLNLILSLPKDDVFITSACLAFWRYDDIEDIVVKLRNHFGKNFMLEIQYQPFDLQYKINKRILELSKKYNIQMIVGTDSHYIYPEQKKDRDEVLKSKGIHYDDEDNFYMDYPDYDTVVERFKKQNIFTEEQIIKALDNTNVMLTFGNFDDVEIFKDNIKLPSLYPKLNQNQKNNKLKNIILKEWNKVKPKIDKEKIKEYEKEIRKEFKIIVDTGMTDYFLLDYEIVKEAIKNGGIITPSGRGSGVSFYINTLLGFSKIDRVSANIKMYPERFMSVSRIKGTKSLPDLDLNLGNPEIFQQAQNKIFGKEHSYPMIAYGTFKTKSAFKMYAKAQDVDFEVANKISDQLKKYEKDLNNAEEDEKDLIDVYDYVDKEFHEIYNKSIRYQGIISDKKPHPCGHLIYNKDIREEIGLIKVKTESTKKETIVCLLDGESAEKFKFLKNDLLKVDVAKLNFLISKRIDKKIPTQNQLIKLCEDNDKVWNIYKKGLTVGINQVEKKSTTKKMMKYKANNINELCHFIAGIRPSFKSMYKIFEDRKYFEYGIPSFDKIIQSTGLDSSFVLYQETIMAVLSFAGFEDDKTYDIIKAISKKKKKIINEIKPKFIKNISNNFIDNDGIDVEKAKINADKVWTIIENSAKYGFNASHSYSMAYDSLLCAYYKSHHTLEFYEVLLSEFNAKKNKDKISKLKQEMISGFGIELRPLKFGNDNRGFSLIRENNSMNQPLSSVKFMNDEICEDLYKIGKNKYSNFVDLLSEINNQKILDSRQLNILIKLDYFSEFGKSQYLLDIVNIYNNINDRKVIKKSDLKKFGLTQEIMERYSERITEKQYNDFNSKLIVEELVDDLEDKSISLVDKIKTEIEYLGYIKYKDDNISDKIYYVEELKQYKNKNQAYIKMYSINSGKTINNFKITKDFLKNEFREGSIVKIINNRKDNKRKKDENGEWQKTKEFWNIPTNWKVLSL